MKLTYRAVRYQKFNSIPEAETTNQSRTYRGVNWEKSSLLSGRASQAMPRLKYRGVDYLI